MEIRHGKIAGEMGKEYLCKANIRMRDSTMAKIIYNKYVPFGGFLAINLFGIIFAKRKLNKVDVNHELIHSAQIRELLYVPFYVLYLAEWIYKSIRYKGFLEGYRNISFEREAYRNQHDLRYLKNRKRFASIKYIRK